MNDYEKDSIVYLHEGTTKLMIVNKGSLVPSVESARFLLLYKLDGVIHVEALFHRL